MSDSSWSNILWHYQNRKIFTDIEIICKDNERIVAHRAILASGNCHWKSILTDQTHEDYTIVLAKELEYTNVLSDIFNIYFKNDEEQLVKYNKTTTIVDPCTDLKHNGKFIKSSDTKAKSRKGKESKNANKDKAGNEVLSCHICEKSFSSKKHLLSHRLLHNPEKWNFQCPFCDKKFMTKRLLVRHKAKEHGEKLECDICGKGFSSDSNLLLHKKSVHANDEERCTCEVCGLIFKSKRYLAVHLKKHSKEGPDFQAKNCPVCDKVVVGRYFYQHVQLHNPKTWKFQCDFCDQRFQTKYKKIEHTAVTHTGDKPFRCEKCDEHFQTTGRRALHKRTCAGNQSESNLNLSTTMQNGNIGRVKTERVCALSWFSNWTPEQREQFCNKVVEMQSLDLTTEALLRELDSMSLSGQRRESPSVFECQLRIFDNWFRGWPMQDKQLFLTEICVRYPQFTDRFRNMLL